MTKNTKAAFNGSRAYAIRAKKAHTPSPYGKKLNHRRKPQRFEEVEA